jgi:hypothetical protein
MVKTLNPKVNSSMVIRSSSAVVLLVKLVYKKRKLKSPIELEKRRKRETPQV